MSGYRTEPNSKYRIAQANYFEAQSGLVEVRSQRTVGLAAAIINGIAIGMWEGKVKDARQALESTPANVRVDEFDNYKYSVSDISTRRTLTANYYVIDRRAAKYFKGTFDMSEVKPFKIAYNLHDKDPGRANILTGFSAESDIAVYERSPMRLPISSLIEDYLKNEGSAKDLPSLVGLRDEMLADKNKALASYKSSQYTAKAINDPRFDSVVVVSNPKGALGTGFFVAPDLVLTNFHVIEGSQFIEMRLYNGLETFGKVVKTDVRLDLALLNRQLSIIY